MRWMRAAFAATIVAGSSGLLLFCVGDTNNPGQDASTKDSGAGGDADAAPPAEGFTLTLTPSHITTDPGDSNVKIDIGVLRAAGFTDDVSFTINAPAHVTATNAVDTGNGGTSSSFTVSVDSQAPLGDFTLTVTAANPTKSFVQNAPLGIRVGSLVDLGDGGIVVPSWANALVVKAWGAGGGAACASCDPNAGGGTSAGGGGFASGTVAVTPSSTLVAVVGTGGSPGHPSLADAGCTGTVLFGGGGGGFTGLQVQGGNYLIIAGGGGAGTYYGGGAGGAGGGSSGENGSGQSCNGGGGTQTQGGDGGCGGQNGGPLQGGDGYNSGACPSSVPQVQGGSPGGGKGGISGFGGGGGGGGWFGGGGGGFSVTAGNGGGGSGFTASDAGTLTTGSGTAGANTSDPDYVAHCASGSAGGGAPSTNGGVGGGGCIVIRYAKP